MYKEAIYPILILCLLACSPKVIVQQSASSKLEALPRYAPFAVFELEDDFTPSTPQLLGNIRIKDGGLSVQCDFKTVLGLAAKEARAMGGNCVKITEHRKPDHVSTCHRIRAAIYKIANPEDFEEEIIWHEARKLAIRDFKGSTEKRPFQAATVSSFQYFTERNPLNAQFVLKAESLFYCPGSYFKPSENDSLILAHEQLHFDITEIYARKFVKKVAETVSNHTTLINEHEKIAKEVFEELQLKQDEYDSEVYADISKQPKWNAWVAAELQALADYKDKTVALDK